MGFLFVVATNRPLPKPTLELDNRRCVTQPTGLVVTNNRILPEAPLRGASDAFFLFVYRYDLAELDQLAEQGPTQPILKPDTGREAVAITHTGVDDSSARSVSYRVRKTRHVETLSNLVRPAERPSARPDTNNRAAASWVLLRVISAAWLLRAAQN